MAAMRIDDVDEQFAARFAETWRTPDLAKHEALWSDDIVLTQPMMGTLRGERAYEFLDRLMSVAIPRIRDFRGLNPRAFDGRGNYSMGVREQIIFPEIDYDSIASIRGLDVAITTTAKTDEEAHALLRGLGMPFAGSREES